jgi:hypothetical protein
MTTKAVDVPEAQQHVAEFVAPVVWDDSVGHLVGLWGSEVVFGPEIRGELTIVQQGPDWSASIAGIEVPVRTDKDTLRFVLPGARGAFRGRLVKTQTKIIGHWLQPQPAHVWSYSYATPVELKAMQYNVWRGEVLPLDDGESMYVMIYRQKNGSLEAFFRNPERNLGRVIGHRSVEWSDDTVRFISQHTGVAALVGRYDKSSDILSIFFPTESATFDFTRRGREEASGFYPRISRAEAYVYRPPMREEDGWETASLAEVGFDQHAITQLIQDILKTEPTDITAPYLQGLLIARHGKLVLEEYFHGFHKNRVHDTRSASKTLTSTLVGIAIDQGAPFDVT